MVRKIIIPIGLLLISFFCVGCTKENSSSQKFDSKEIYNAYADYICNEELYEGQIPAGEFETDDTKLVFSLEYIDEDNIPEVIIGWTKMLNNTSDVLILTYRDGKVTKLGPIGHFNIIEFIPKQNVVMENNAYYGECTYWYGRINDESMLEMICSSSVPMCDDEDMDSITSSYFIGQEEVSEEEYNKYLARFTAEDFVTWSGESNKYDLDVLNSNSIEKLRVGIIKPGRMEEEHAAAKKLEEERNNKQLTPGSIQAEMAETESKSEQVLLDDDGQVGSEGTNEGAAKSYQIWDDELNSLWSRLNAEINEDSKAKLLDEQRAWIEEKDRNVIVSGLTWGYHSGESWVEYNRKEYITRERAYVLAGYLASIRGEDFSVPDYVQKNIKANNPPLDEVFESLKGQCKNGNSEISVERSEEVHNIAPKGSKWVVCKQDEIILSDLDVYGYDSDGIVFFSKGLEGGCDNYYWLRKSLDGVSLTYANSLNEL